MGCETAACWVGHECREVSAFLAAYAEECNDATSGGQREALTTYELWERIHSRALCRSMEGSRTSPLPRPDQSSNDRFTGSR